MKYRIVLYSAWTSLFSNKRRISRTIFGIVISIISIIVILTLGNGFKNHIYGYLNPKDAESVETSIIFESEDFEWMQNYNNDFFTDNDIQLIRSIPGVLYVAEAFDKEEIIKLSVNLNNKEKLMDVSISNDTNFKIILGRDINENDNNNNSRVAVIPLSIAQQISGKYEDTLNSYIEIDKHIYTIVGVFEDYNNYNVNSITTNLIKIPKNTYNNIHDRKLINNELKIGVDKKYSLLETSKSVVSKLNMFGSLSYKGVYNFVDVSKILETINNIINKFTFFFISTVLITLTISALSLVNMMYLNIYERRREIAIRRAIGATRKDIQMQFVLEGIFIALIGCIIALIISGLIVYLFSIIIGIDVTIEAKTVIIVIVVSILTGILSSYGPANYACKSNISLSI